MTQNPTGIDLIAMANRGQEAAANLDFIEQQVSKVRKSVFNKAFTALSTGSLTPEQALQYWQEIYAYHRVLKTFETAITMGKSAGMMSPQAHMTPEAEGNT